MQLQLGRNKIPENLLTAIAADIAFDNNDDSCQILWICCDWLPSY